MERIMHTNLIPAYSGGSRAPIPIDREQRSDPSRTVIPIDREQRSD